MADRDLSRSRAVLIGCAHYHDSGIPDLPAADGSLRAMTDLLTGELCGWPAECIKQMPDVANSHELARAIKTAVRDAQDAVLLYYVGHGLHTHKGDLALALSDTDAAHDMVYHTAMRYESVVEILRGCSAPTKLIILDCCHAELGDKANAVFQSGDFIDRPVDGVYFIAASKTREKAKAPTDGTPTYFTQNLIKTINQGVPNKSELLSIDQIFDALRDRMARQGLPEPTSSKKRSAQNFPFARNATPAAPDSMDMDADDEANRVRHVRRTRILASAEGAARAITAARTRAIALASVAAAMAATDPGRAGLLIAEAVRTTESIAGEAKSTALGAVAQAALQTGGRWYAGRAGYTGRVGFADAVSIKDVGTAALRTSEAIEDYESRSSVLAAVAEAMAAVDPASAALLAQNISGKDSKVLALTGVAAALGPDDRSLARQLVADAEQTARTITGRNMRTAALVQVAKAAASAFDQATADRLIAELDCAAQAHAARDSKMTAMARRAMARAETKSRASAKAETGAADSARGTKYKCWKAQTLADVATALAGTAPVRAAELIAEACQTVHSITADDPKRPALASVASGLTAVATALLAEDPIHSTRLVAEAEHLARVITDERVRVALLACLALALRPTDPGQASQMVSDAERIARSITDRGSRAQALASVAMAAAPGTAHAAGLVAEAERLAQEIIHPSPAASSRAGFATAPNGDTTPLAGITTAPNGDTTPLAGVATALAAIDSDAAEGIAQLITDESLRVTTLVYIAAALL